MIRRLLLTVAVTLLIVDAIFFRGTYQVYPFQSVAFVSQSMSSQDMKELAAQEAAIGVDPFLAGAIGLIFTVFWISSRNKCFGGGPSRA